MSKLIKYEFRKSLMSKLIFLGVTAAMEIVFLVGVLGDFENPTFIGMIGLFFTALAGIAYIGIESILILYRDLTTKQSYMLFMTPNSSYRILGAKAIENGCAVLLSGLFFGGLAALDFWLILGKYGEFQQFLDMFKNMLVSIDARLDLSTRSLAAVLFMTLCSWILKIVTGYLAVVTACTLLSGKKGAAFISFILYIAIGFFTGWLLSFLPENMDVITRLLSEAGLSMAFSALMYFITAWLMDKKLSV